MSSLDLMGHFHQFSHLPFELRWTVWQMAICTDDSPRIHYYSILHEKTEQHRQNFFHLMMNASFRQPKLVKPLEVSTTKPTFISEKLYSPPPSSQFWTEANRFHYHWNSGLRTACKESRRALLHHFQNTEAQLKKKPAVAARHYNENVRIELHRRDIVCLRFSPKDLAVCCSFLRWDVLLPRLPFIQLPQFTNINLAFEFDDSWADGFEFDFTSAYERLMEPSQRGLVLRACRAWNANQILRRTRIWLIDRSGRLHEEGWTPAERDKRNEWDAVYDGPMDYFRQPCDDHIFFDGKTTYMESRHSGKPMFGAPRCAQRYDPISWFIWQAGISCRHRNQEPYQLNLPCPELDQFLRVLRPLPGFGGTP